MKSRLQFPRFQVGAVVMLTWLFLAIGSPASAHTAGASSSTNYSSVIESVTPAVDGVVLRGIQGGDQLELQSTKVETTVFGYDGEPYLRVGPEGSYANRNSPAFYLNRSARANYKVPDYANAKATPQWEKTSGDSAVLWHDHRAHWMADLDPPVVRNEPQEFHLIIPQWTVTMAAGGQTITATGRLEWVPGPPAWHGYVEAFAVFLVVFGLLVRRPDLQMVRRMLGALIVLDIVHNAGTLAATSGPFLVRATAGFESLFPALVAWIVGVAAMSAIRQENESAPWLVLFSALVITILGGFVPLDDLGRSQVVFDWGADFARLLVVATLGLGGGLTAASLWRIYRSSRKHPMDDALVASRDSPPVPRPAE